MTTPPLQNMTHTARAVWLEAYELGSTEGWQRGYEAAEADLAALQRRAYAVVKNAAHRDSLPFDQMCERRGEHARAERQRQLLTERGVTA